MKKEIITVVNRNGDKKEIESEMPDHGPDPTWKMIDGKLYGWANRNHHSPALYLEASLECHARAKEYFERTRLTS